MLIAIARLHRLHTRLHAGLHHARLHHARLHHARLHHAWLHHARLHTGLHRHHSWLHTGLHRHHSWLHTRLHHTGLHRHHSWLHTRLRGTRSTSMNHLNLLRFSCCCRFLSSAATATDTDYSDQNYGSNYNTPDSISRFTSAASACAFVV